MIYTELTIKAMKIAFKAHEGQVDKAEIPYINHPLHLAESMDDEISTIVALLHDVVEDTSITISDLKEQGIPDEALVAIMLLTHEDGVPYMDYVNKLKDNPIAKKVKIADLRHNMDVSRMGEDWLKMTGKQKKYKQALTILTSED